MRNRPNIKKKNPYSGSIAALRSSFARRYAACLAGGMLLATIYSGPGNASPSGNAGGLIAGSFAATPAGAGTFHVPIQVPPGIGGLQPDLALNYNSQNTSNGPLGIGWNLSGTSALLRCGQSIPIDGRKGGVQYKFTDRLCKDGQRLIARKRIILPRGYWFGNKYSTEIEEWSTTIQTGGTCASKSPCSFETRYPNGQVAVYGGTVDSRVLSARATDGERQIRQWLMSEIRDASGNALRFEYTNGGANTAVIKRIEYDGRSVEFTYDNRGVRDQVIAYDGTGRTALSKRLREIRISTTNGVFKTYRLKYEGDPLSARSRLSKIDECDSGGTCMDPITIVWSGPGGPDGSFRDVVPGGGQYQAALRYDPGAKIIPGDFNGDGKTDFIRQEKGKSDNDNVNTFRVYMSRGDGEFDVHQPGRNVDGDRFQDSLRHDPGAKILTGDFNGDGKTDFLRQEHGDWGKNNRDTFQVYFSRGDGNFDIVQPGSNRSGDPYQHSLRAGPGVVLTLGDFNGDGKTDFLRQERGDWDNNYNHNFQVYFSRGDGYFDIVQPGLERKHDPYQDKLRYDAGALLIPGDFNGDGKTDFVRQEKGKWGNDTSGTFSIYLSKGDGQFDVVAQSGDFLQADLRLNKGARITPADINGDGKTDLLAQGSFIWDPPGDRTFFRVLISRGDGNFDKKSNWRQGYKHNGWLQSDWSNLIPIDYNGDGKMDFIRQIAREKRKESKDAFQVYVSRGDGFFDIKDPGGWLYEEGLRDNKDGGANIIVGDFDGDGRGDFIRQEKGAWDDDTNNTFGVFFAAKKPDNLRYSSVANILQGPVTHRFGYQRLSRHNMNAGMNFPAGHVGFRSPMNVLRVYERIVPTGLPGTVSTQTIRRTYDYRGATRHRGGRGFMGFQRMTVTSPAEGIRTASDYHVVFPLSGRLTSSVTHTADGKQVIASSAETSVSAAGAVAGAYHPRLTKRVEKRLFPEGAQRTESTMQYDSLGNPILITDFDGGRTLSTCSSFANNLSAKRPGPLTGRTQATSCSVSGDSCSCSNPLSKTKMTHDTLGRVDSIQTYDDTRDDWLTLSYEYDNRGNRIRVIRESGAVVDIAYDSTYDTYPVSITTRADGKIFTESREYDARFGAILREVDANGALVRRELDDFGRLRTLRRTAPDGGLALVESHSYARESDHLYSQTSSFVQSWDGAASVTRKRFSDALGREVRIVSAAGGDAESVRSRLFGAWGQVLRESSPTARGQSAQWTEYAYDERRDLVGLQHPGGANVTVSRGMGGLCQAHQLRVETSISNNGPGRHSIRCENVRGLVERLRLIDTTTGEHTDQYYARDGLDRLIAASDGQTSVSVERDSLGRRKRIASDDRGVTSYAYDARGFLASESSNGEIKNFTYDEMGRETRIDFHDGSHASFEYDDGAIAYAQGRLSRAIFTGADGVEASRREYAYDPDGNLTVSALQIDGAAYAVGYSADPQGRPADILYPGGRRACYNYDRQGFLADIRVAADGDCAGSESQRFAQYTDYTPEGQPGRIEFGNGVSTDFAFDANYRLSSATTVGSGQNGEAATFLDQHYSWTPLGEVLSIDDRAGDKDASYTYNGFGYLTRAVGAYGDIAYEYNQSGNLLRKGDLTITYAGNRPTGASDGLSLAYDAHGNVIRRETGDARVFDYEYDGRYQIQRVLRDGAVAGLYEYDAGGQRVKKTDGSGIETIYVSRDFEVARYPDGRVFQTEYISSPSGRIGAFTSETTGGLAGGTGVHQAATTAATLKAQMYSTSSLMGLTGYMGYSIQAALSNPQSAVLARAVVFALFTAAVCTFFILRMLRTAHDRGFVGRLRAACLWRLADMGVLRPTTAAAFASGGNPATAYHARRRRLFWPTPLVLSAMMAFSMQCGASGGDAPMLFAPGGGDLAVSAALGPGQNGYGYPEPGTYYFQQDQVGSTSLITDEQGKVVACTVYKPYGEVHQEASEGRDVFRSKFNGNEWDRDGEMYYFNARYYDPSLGSFLQADSLLFGTEGDNAASLNRYAFAANNPASYADPGGQLVPLLGVMAVAIAKAAVAASAAASAAAAAAAAAATAAAAAAASAAAAAGSAAIAAAAAAGSALAASASTIATFALTGAAIGAVSYGIEVAATGSTWDWGNFGIAIGIGAVAGIIGGGVASGFSSLASGFTLAGTVVSSVGGSSALATGLVIMARVSYGLSFLMGGATQAFVTSTAGQAAANGGEVDWKRVGLDTGLGGALGIAGPALGAGAKMATPSLRAYAGSAATRAMQNFSARFPEAARRLGSASNMVIANTARRLPEGFAATTHVWLTISGKAATKVFSKGSIFGGSRGGYENDQ